ncbi:NADH-quinone oxidoreductase subunit NuoK [Cytophagales bacterium LB-30]|uniref:NADH-quinone oxidoreductase subunit K n=1 Tax=Shiella aurantiaca TaxID=3058365 RepID=A0ABT8F9F5_9BACT|nr:NADH-quinone oxidoreductase subunit NuoK [Shiella aurantiaca]MDN4166999.1 NADH-quinone oxidoreductase subunit NuoK [Shiella aurantiaca]
MIPLSHILLFSTALLVIGLVIMLTKKNAIMMLMGLELMLNASNINLVAFGNYYAHMQGSTFALVVMVVAAAEVAVALAIITKVYRYYKTSEVDQINDITD